MAYTWNNMSYCHGPIQSPCRRFHSSILKLARAAADLGNVTLLRLLDLSVVFDTVDHHIIINRLQSTFAIHGTVQLISITSFIISRAQTMNVAGRQSTMASHNSCCSVLYTLQLLNTSAWSSMQHSVAVVQPSQYGLHTRVRAS